MYLIEVILMILFVIYPFFKVNKTIMRDKLIMIESVENMDKN